MRKKRFYIWLTLLICLLMFAVPVQAAGKNKFSVRVNENGKAVLEQEGERWHLTTGDAKKDKEIFAAKVVYLKISKGKELISGYYTFNRKGYLDTRKTFHSLDTKIGTQRFKGWYYFGEENGRLWTEKRGWTKIGKKTYYLSRTGRMYTDQWVKGYYLMENGQIAKNMQTPDGYYVDCDGRKCQKEEVSLSGLKKELTSMISRYSGTWSVYVKDLKTGDVVSINDREMKPASVIKLFVMAATYDSIKNGTIKKTSQIDSLLNSMITVSDNESFNSLVRKNSPNGSFVDGCKTVNQYLKKIGCTKTGCHSTLHPSNSSFTWDGSSNVTSAKDAGLVLESIYKGKCVSAKYSKEMLNLLLRQTRTWKIPSGLPSGIKCANKTGENDSCQNDVAIVYGKKTTYVVCIFAETDEYSGINGIQSLSSKIYTALNS